MKLLVVVLVALLSVVFADEPSCGYTSASGQVFDLSPLQLPSGQTYKYLDAQNNTWYYTVCGDMTGTPSGCPTTSAVCLKPAGSATAINAGSASTASWGDAPDANAVMVTFSEGDTCATSEAKRKSMVEFNCNPAAVTPAVTSALNDGCMSSLKIDTAAACGGSSSDSGSGSGSKSDSGSGSDSKSGSGSGSDSKSGSDSDGSRKGGDRDGDDDKDGKDGEKKHHKKHHGRKHHKKAKIIILCTVLPAVAIAAGAVIFCCIRRRKMRQLRERMQYPGVAFQPLSTQIPVAVNSDPTPFIYYPAVAPQQPNIQQHMQPVTLHPAQQPMSDEQYARQLQAQLNGHV